MKFFVSAVPAPIVTSPFVKLTGMLAAAMMTVLAVAQLFTFEAFSQLFVVFDLPLSRAVVYVLAPFLVVAEVFALPYLLRMTLSPAFRLVSRLLGFAAAAGWLAVSLWVAVNVPEVTNIGLFGEVIPVQASVGVVLSLALFMLVGWMNWGQRQTK